MFAAIELPAELQFEVAACVHRAELSDARLVDQAKYHITLAFYGEVGSGAELAGLECGLQRAAAEAGPFDLALGGAGCFPESDAIWLGVITERQPLGALFEAVSNETAGIGSTADDRAGHTTHRYQPHLTVAWMSVAHPDRDRAVARLAAEPLRAAWRVASVSLFETRPDTSHRQVALFPLGS